MFYNTQIGQIDLLSDICLFVCLFFYLYYINTLALSVLITSPFPLNFLSSSPKSVFSGSLGCGNLSERRASGLVFCESNTSEYKTICVSSPVLFHLYSASSSGMQCWVGLSPCKHES